MGFLFFHWYRTASPIRISFRVTFTGSPTSRNLKNFNQISPPQNTALITELKSRIDQLEKVNAKRALEQEHLHALWQEIQAELKTKSDDNYFDLINPIKALMVENAELRGDKVIYAHRNHPYHKNTMSDAPRNPSFPTGYHDERISS